MANCSDLDESTSELEKLLSKATSYEERSHITKALRQKKQRGVVSQAEGGSYDGLRARNGHHEKLVCGSSGALVKKGKSNGVSPSLVKLRALGVGSYGSVHTALYGDTVCAAKSMHQVLFEYKEHGKPSMVERFEQECDLLQSIRHPCIVQFLGKALDPESALPILLMELMDENLTAHLQKSPRPPLYHLQVNICHDIASALSYIHSMGYIHRDVSSNNVLLVAGSCRAKLSDFGVSKLASEQMVGMTICPGSTCYMAPESTTTDGTYTNKIDIFSFGVLGVQIATGKFPQPTGRFESVTVPSGVSPSPGPLLRGISEVERRQNHIKLIPSNHLLKRVFLECLCDLPDNRPSAHDVCELILKHKESMLYVESIQSSKSQESQMLHEKCDSLIQRVEELGHIKESLLADIERRDTEAQGMAAEAEEQRRLVASLRRELEGLSKAQEPLPSSSSRGILRGLGSIFKSGDDGQRLRQAEQQRDRALQERDEAISEVQMVQDETRRAVSRVRDELEWKVTRLTQKEEQYSLALKKYDDLQTEHNRVCNLLRHANDQLVERDAKLDEMSDGFKKKEDVERLEREVCERDRIIDNLSLQLAAEQSMSSHGAQQGSSEDQVSLKIILEFIRRTSNEQIEQLRKQLSDKERELQASQEKVARLERALQAQKDSTSQDNVLLCETTVSPEGETSCSKCVCILSSEEWLVVEECSHRLCRLCLRDLAEEGEGDQTCPVSTDSGFCSCTIPAAEIREVLGSDEVCDLLDTLDCLADSANKLDCRADSANKLDCRADSANKLDCLADSANKLDCRADSVESYDLTGGEKVSTEPSSSANCPLSVGNSESPPDRYDLMPFTGSAESSLVKSKLDRVLSRSASPSSDVDYSVSSAEGHLVKLRDSYGSHLFIERLPDDVDCDRLRLPGNLEPDTEEYSISDSTPHQATSPTPHQALPSLDSFGDSDLEVSHSLEHVSRTGSKTKADPDTLCHVRADPDTPGHVRADPNALGHVRADPDTPCHVRADPDTLCHVRADPDTTHHVRADPNALGHVRADPDTPCHVRADPDTLGHVRADPDTTRHARADPNALDHVRADPDTPCHVRADPDTLGHVRADPDTLGHVRADPDTPHHVRTDPNALGHVRADPDTSCHVRADPDTLQLGHMRADPDTTRHVRADPNALGHVRADPDTTRHVRAGPPNALGHVRADPDTTRHVRADPNAPGHVRADPDTLGHVRADPDTLGHVRRHPQNTTAFDRSVSYPTAGVEHHDQLDSRVVKSLGAAPASLTKPQSLYRAQDQSGRGPRQPKAAPNTVHFDTHPTPPPGHGPTHTPGHGYYSDFPHSEESRYTVHHNYYYPSHPHPHHVPHPCHSPPSYSHYPHPHYAPETHSYRSRTAPMYILRETYPPPPDPYSDPYHPAGYPGHLPVAQPSYSSSTHSTHRRYTSPHPLRLDHHGYRDPYHPHSLSEDSGHTSTLYSDPPFEHHPPSHQPQSSPSPNFQTNTNSLVSSLSSTDRQPDEYLAVLMQQRHRESRDHPWKVVFTVCLRRPSCVKPLQDLLNETFGEQFEVASFCIKFKEAVILRYPKQHVRSQGYNISTDVSPCKITLSEVVFTPSPLEGKATPTYPPRRVLTITPLAVKRGELAVSLTLDGIESCHNQREFNLKPPSVAPVPSIGPQQVRPAPPPAAGPAPASIASNHTPLKQLLDAKTDTNSVAKFLGPHLCDKTLELGQALDVPYNIIKQIQSDTSGSGMQYRWLCELVEHWHKNTTEPKWLDIVRALKNMREQQLVRVLEEHLRQKIA